MMYVKNTKPHIRDKKNSLRLTQEEIKEINRLWREGYTITLIVKIMKRSPTTIEKAIEVKL